MRTLALMLAVVLGAGTAPAGAAIDDHATALAAVADMHAAIAEIVRIEDGYAVGHPAYVRAAHRALNALVGRRDDGYAPSFGDPGDGAGTLGHLDALLDRNGTSLWTPAVQGAKANVLAAAANLQDALGQREMEEYEADLTRALASLALVAGRSDGSGVLGGLSGALANTTLGIPAGAPSVSGCGVPLRAPSYGVVSERLAFVALSRTAASAGVPAELSVSRVVVRGDDVIIYTHAAPEALRLCRRVSRLQRTRAVRVAVAAPAGAASYTPAQARLGAKVYAQNCVQCHGTNLQGTAGPGVAGSEFLTSARTNRWTLSDLRTTVVENMPFSNPGSLTPTQYADVMAFLLASNCYPAGAKPFPAADSPAFKSVKIGPVSGAKPTTKLGTCAVR